MLIVLRFWSLCAVQCEVLAIDPCLSLHLYVKYYLLLEVTLIAARVYTEPQQGSAHLPECLTSNQRRL